jgi:hypothetical protein
MRAARVFMRSTKAASVVDTASASARAASLAESAIMPCRSCAIVAGCPGERNMRVPGARAELTDAVTCCSGASWPSRIASNTTYAVMSLVSDAGSIASASPAAASVCPETASRSTYARAAMGGGTSAGAAAASSGTRHERTSSLRIGNAC